MRPSGAQNTKSAGSLIHTSRIPFDKFIAFPYNVNMVIDMASPPASETFVANVRRELAARGWNQTDLATKCDWPPARISEILGQKRNVRLATAEKIADAFGVGVASLLVPAIGVFSENLGPQPEMPVDTTSL